MEFDICWDEPTTTLAVKRGNVELTTVDEVIESAVPAGADSVVDALNMAYTCSR